MATDSEPGVDSPQNEQAMQHLSMSRGILQLGPLVNRLGMRDGSCQVLECLEQLITANKDYAILPIALGKAQF